MKSFLKIPAILLIGSVLFSEDIWVGIYVYGQADKSPAYWLGAIEKSEYETIVRGEKENGYFKLKEVCYWDDEKEGKKVKWSVVEQKDEIEIGEILFRREKLDRIILLNGDPRKKFIYKDEEGEIINKENW